MNINDIINKIISQDKPCEPFEKSDDIWTDPYISTQLLKTHLDENTDLASYKPERRRKTADNIIGKCNLSENSRVLDLGCGPGLYSGFFAERGIKYTGVDISALSIGHAISHRNGREDIISFRQLNYLNLNYKHEFDACFMIWCDFGVLSPQERTALLSGTFAALKPGGHFAFDVFSSEETNMPAPTCNWRACDGGFWHPGPHIELERTEYFEQGALRLDQCTIACEDYVKTYRIWDKHYSRHEISGFLKEAGFTDIECNDGGLSGEQPGVWGIYCSK